MAREDVIRSWMGDLIRTARVSRGLTREQLRQNFPTKISLSMIGHIETGTRALRFEDLPEWARALSGKGSIAPISEATMRRMFMMTIGYVSLEVPPDFIAPIDPTGGETQRQYWDLRWRDFNPRSVLRHAERLQVWQNHELDDVAWMQSTDSWDLAPSTWTQVKDEPAPQWLIELLREVDLLTVVREITAGTSGDQPALRGTYYQDWMTNVYDEDVVDWQPNTSITVTLEGDVTIEVPLPDVSTGRVKRGTHIPGYDDEVAWDLLHLNEGEKTKVRDFVRKLIEERGIRKPTKRP